MLGLFLGSSHVIAAGLSGGEQFSTMQLSGHLTVQCNTPQGTSSAYTNCNSEILNPGEYSYFSGPQTNADAVSLQATREDGSVSKIKSEKYDGVLGKSKKSFNLWISTLFQHPLLGMGKNNVKYILSKDGKSVEEGTFIVTVIDGGRSVCQRSGFYFSSVANDCNMPSTYCSRYFNENNYCQ